MKYRDYHNREYNQQQFLSKFKPRNWQVDAIKNWCKNMSGIVSVVTGGGKTTYAYYCMLRFNFLYPKGRIFILVPTISLQDQWYVNLIEDFKISENNISCIGGGSNQNPNIINIVVLNTARKVMSKLSNGHDTFLIVDECHRAGSETNSIGITDNHKATLGLSATPERNDDGFDEKLIPYLGEIIFKYEYLDAIKDRIISNFDLINIQFNLEDHEQEEYDKLTNRIIRVGKSRNISKEEKDEKLKILFQKRASISNNALMRIPVSVKIAGMHKKDKVIVFHENIAAAQNIFKLLNERKMRVGMYHSKMGSVLRKNNLVLFKKSIINYLITCRALDEGLNVPDANISIISSSTASNRQRIQRLGRVLRPAENKEKAVIYTLFSTEQERERLKKEESELDQFSEITWRYARR